MAELPRRSDRPHDRLTQLCAEMTDALDAHGDDVADVKAVIMLDDGDRGGIVLHGYDDDTDAMVDLFVHLKAIFEANGKQLLIAPIGGQG